MLRWPIRLKLMVGLTLVVGMMLILMGGSIFGLHSFHITNLTLGDQLREIGASTELFATVLRLHPPREDSADADRLELEHRVHQAREALQVYFRQLKENTTKGNRGGSGLDELGLALIMDEDLTAILNELDPNEEPVEPLFPGTTIYVPDLLSKFKPASNVKSRIDRLYETVSNLARNLHLDFWTVLQMSQGQYQTSRIIVWSSAVMVLGMLCGLTSLFHRWVLTPVRMLQRGVRHVAARFFRLQNQPEVGRRDAGSWRGLQRHDGQDQRDLRRPGASGARSAVVSSFAPNASRESGSWPRAWLTRSITRWPPSPSAPRLSTIASSRYLSSSERSRSPSRRQLSENDPGGSISV